MTVVFIDRDGVINRNREDYVRTADEFEFLPGALEGLARLKQAGIGVVVVSNQAGVGKGLIEPGELDRINDLLLRGVVDHGGEIAGLYYCFHRKEDRCDCRKPKIGLFTKAGNELGFDPAGCYSVGDTESDIEAGHRAGCRTVLVLTGKSSHFDPERWHTKPEHIAADLPGAVEWIVSAIRSKG